MGKYTAELASYYHFKVIINCIQINGKHISWDHVVQLYKKKQSLSGLSMIPKLTREHVYLNSYSRMKAAQVSKL